MPRGCLGWKLWGTASRGPTRARFRLAEGKPSFVMKVDGAGAVIPEEMDRRWPDDVS